MKKALIAAVNAYPQQPLRGCLNDAANWQQTLTVKGFQCAMLLEGWATKANVLYALNNLVNGAIAGDSLVFVWSGHGSYVPDNNGDESDGRDEVICTVDVFDGNYIKDDDIRAILNLVPAGVAVDFFHDSCYSGTGTRGCVMNKKCVGEKFLELPQTGKRKTRVNSRIVTVVPNLNHCAWMGCTDTETSKEVSVGGKIQGAFSYYANKYIRLGGTRATIISNIQASVARLNIQQTPQLESTVSESIEQPFS